MIEAVIFDMDGVLVDSEVLKAEGWEKGLLEKYGIKEGGKWYLQIVGGPRDELSRKTIERFNLPLNPNSEQDLEELFQTIRAPYEKRLKERDPLPIESSIKFLKSLPRDKVKIGLASSEYLDRIIEHLDLMRITSCFDAIFSGMNHIDNDRERKPHPKVYLLTAKELGVEPGKCVVIEDSYTGVEAARRAGMKCIGYENPNSGNQDLSRADFTTNNLSQLTIEVLNGELFGN